MACPSARAGIPFLLLILALVVFALGGCSGAQLANVASRFQSADVVRDLSFGSDPRLQMDVYFPTRLSEQGRVTPVVVFYFGGSWLEGDKRDYEFVGRRLASMGFIAAIPNYRVYPQVRYPVFLSDSAKALPALIQFLERPEYQSYRPASSLILMGHSAGAYNAAMLALDNRWLQSQNLERQSVVRAFIGLAGPYDFFPIQVPEIKPVFFDPDYPKAALPLDHVDPMSPPTLLMIAESDEVVSGERNSMRLHQALISNQVSSELAVVAGTNHVTLLGSFSPILPFHGNAPERVQAFISGLEQVPSLHQAEWP